MDWLPVRLDFKLAFTALAYGVLPLAVLVWVVRSRRSVTGRAMRLANALIEGRQVDVERVLSSLPPGRRASAAALVAREVAEAVRGSLLDEPEDDEEDEAAWVDDGDEGEEPAPRDGPLTTIARDLARRAAAEADADDVTTRAEAARALALVGEPDLARDLIAGFLDRADGLPQADLVRVARVALDVEADGQAERLFARALERSPGDLDLIAGRAEALLALDRPADAVPLLEPALLEVRRRMRAPEWRGEALEDLWRHVTDLHEDAVRRSASAEKVIDLHVAAGALDTRAGVNYRLMGHSILVESDRAPRRVAIVGQDALRAAADRALAAAKDDPGGLEDLGLWHLREGAPELAERAFHRAIDADPRAWPSFVGLGAALDARERPLRRWLADAVDPPVMPDLPRLVDAWEALTADERRLIALSVAPSAAAVPTLVEAGARLHVVSLDARCTDLPAFADARGAQVEDEGDRRTHDAIEGLARGLVAAAKIETFYERREEGWTVAHELGHVLLEVLGDELFAEVEELFARAEEAEYLSTEYGQRNVHEFFATGYERFVWREAFPDAPRDEIHTADVTLGLDAFFRELAQLIAATPRAS